MPIRLLGMARTPLPPAAPSAVVLLLLLAGAGDTGEADAEKLVTSISKPDHSARFTSHSMGKGFSLS